MADPAVTEEPMTTRQTAGDCALLLGLALGLGSIAWRGYERVQEGAADGGGRSLSGLAAFLMLAGLVVGLRGHRLPVPKPQPSWREAAVRAWPATAGTVIAMLAGNALGRELWPSWLRLVGTLPVVYAAMLLVNRYPYRWLRGRNVDPRTSNPLQ